jgi:hypothetical protein
MICPLCKLGWDSPCECGVDEAEEAADRIVAEVFARHEAELKRELTALGVGVPMEPKEKL